MLTEIVAGDIVVANEKLVDWLFDHFIVMFVYEVEHIPRGLKLFVVYGTMRTYFYADEVIKL
jgi:hypothetical protein